MEPVLNLDCWEGWEYLEEVGVVEATLDLESNKAVFKILRRVTENSSFVDFALICNVDW